MIYKYSSHPKFLLLAISGLIASLQQILIAYMVQTLTNAGTGKNFSQLPQFLAITILGLLITFLASLLFNRLKTGAMQEANTTLRVGILRGMLTQTREENAASLGFLTNDFKLLETNRFDAEIEILMQSYMIILALGYALSVNWLITLLFLLGSCLPMFVSNLFQKPIQKASENWTKANSKYVNQTKNFLSGSEVLRLYGAQNNAVSRNKPLVARLENSLRKMNLLQLDTTSWLNLVANLFTFLLPFLAGIYLVIKGQTTLGALFAIVQLSNSFINPILTILADRNKLATTKKIVVKAEEYMNKGKGKSARRSARFESLEVRHLFLLREKKKLVQGINFCLRPRQKIAIIGPSGVGKSTLLQYLLTGDYGKAWKILLNKKMVKAGSFSNLFAYANQTPVIFATDLWFNLTLGKNISPQKVKQVCQKLALNQLIEEKGFAYSLGENADQLSGGQLARIELARAILSQRPVLLLDEINASLDRATSKQIHHYLLSSNFTMLEVIHHYQEADLRKYDQVIDLQKYLA